MPFRAFFIRVYGRSATHSSVPGRVYFLEFLLKPVSTETPFPAEISFPMKLVSDCGPMEKSGLKPVFSLLLRVLFQNLKV
jgi:hypothetical protein